MARSPSREARLPTRALSKATTNRGKAATKGIKKEPPREARLPPRKLARSKAQRKLASPPSREARLPPRALSKARQGFHQGSCQCHH